MNDNLSLLSPFSICLYCLGHLLPHLHSFDLPSFACHYLVIRFPCFASFANINSSLFTHFIVPFPDACRFHLSTSSCAHWRPMAFILDVSMWLTPRWRLLDSSWSMPLTPTLLCMASKQYIIISLNGKHLHSPTCVVVIREYHQGISLFSVLRCSNITRVAASEFGSQFCGSELWRLHVDANLRDKRYTKRQNDGGVWKHRGRERGIVMIRVLYRPRFLQLACFIEGMCSVSSQASNSKQRAGNAEATLAFALSSSSASSSAFTSTSSFHSLADHSSDLFCPILPLHSLLCQSCQHRHALSTDSVTLVMFIRTPLSPHGTSRT